VIKVPHMEDVIVASRDHESDTLYLASLLDVGYVMLQQSTPRMVLHGFSKHSVKQIVLLLNYYLI